MPRSKLSVENEKFLDEESEDELEASQPENVAARALANRAKEDVKTFWETLARKCALLAAEEMAALLPHIKYSTDPRTRTGGIRFSDEKRNGNKKVLDVLLAALDKGSHNIEEIDPYNDDYDIKPQDDPSDPIEDYVFRERVKALAQGLLTQVCDDDDDNDFRDFDE